MIEFDVNAETGMTEFRVNGILRYTVRQADLFHGTRWLTSPASHTGREYRDDNPGDALVHALDECERIEAADEMYARLAADARY